MKKFCGIFLAMFPLILSNSAWTHTEREREEWKILQIRNTVCEDYKNFYSGKNLKRLIVGVGIAGVFANTSADREIQNWYQESLKNKRTDNFSKTVKLFGEGIITVPLYLGTAFLGELAKDTNSGSTITEWGKRSLRALLVGVPPMLFLQAAIGASRPTENNSYWRSFNDNNGVSGHSFMGAVPFITAAEMVDNRYLRCSLYLGSTFCGFSRINDDAHYFSQAALGWWMAYIAAISEDRIERQKVTVAPTFIHDEIGLMMTFRF